MKPESAIIANNNDQFGTELQPFRLYAASSGWLGATPCVTLLRTPVSGAAADGLLIEVPGSTPSEIALALASPMPLILAVAGGNVPAELIDGADGFVLADDDDRAIAAVLAAAIAPLGAPRVAEGSSRIINALSADAGRIAEQLARLAEERVTSSGQQRPIDAALVRRLIMARRDRARFFPDTLFADPAWDMLLDLAAARLEGKQVPVSSLCIAAAVPTTTALRWVRSLADAGLIERQSDPFDARRSHVSLSDPAAAAMHGWLQQFGDQFAPM